MPGRPGSKLYVCLTVDTRVIEVKNGKRRTVTRKTGHFYECDAIVTCDYDGHTDIPGFQLITNGSSDFVVVRADHCDEIANIARCGWYYAEQQ